MIKVLDQTWVGIVGSESHDLVAECKMISTTTMEVSLAETRIELGQYCDVLVVPHILLTLPVISSEQPTKPLR
jgi:hypothetical protein